MKWRLPTGEGLGLEGVSYWREYFLDNHFLNPSSRRQEEHWHQLYGTEATSFLATTEANAFLTTWAWSTLIVGDAFGNSFDHEVAPVNPY